MAVVVVEVSVDEFDVTLDQRTIGWDFAKVGSKRLGSGNGVDRCQSHDLLVKNGCANLAVNLILGAKR